MATGYTGPHPQVPATPAYTPPQTNVATGCAVCGYYGQCDVKSLAITTRKTPVEIKTLVKLTGTAVTANLRRMHPRTRDFETYDLVVECVATYPGSDPKETADIVGKTEWDPKCSHGYVHELEMVPLNHDEPGLPKTDVAMVELDGVEADTLALELPGGMNVASKLFNRIFELVCAAYGDAHDKSFRLRAISCGVRSSGPVNGTLSAIVYVYRKLKISIKFSMPARGLRLREKKSTEGFNPGTLMNTSSATNRNLLTGVTQSAISAAHEPMSLGSVLSPRAPGLGGADAMAYAGGVDSGLQLEIKVNDADFDITEPIRKILGAIQEIEDLVADFAEMVDKAPQIGWKLSWGIEVLSGSFELAYERKESSTIVDQRLLPAVGHLVLQGEVSFFKAYIDLSFGFHVDGWFADVTATIGLNITGEAKGTWALDVGDVSGSEGSSKATVSGDLDGEVSAIAAIDVTAVGALEAIATAGTGINITGTVYDSEHGGFRPTVEGTLKKGYGKVVVTAGAAVGRTWEGEFWAERRLFTTGGSP